MHGWNRQANRDRDMLMRIVALLVSLAGLADRAGELRGGRHGQLLQLLCYAETVGCDFIFGLMPAASIEYDDTDLAGDPELPIDDAPMLAAAFRVLALVLYAMLRQPLAPAGAIRPQADGSDARAGGRKVFGHCFHDALLLPDTS